MKARDVNRNRQIVRWSANNNTRVNPEIQKPGSKTRSKAKYQNMGSKQGLVNSGKHTLSITLPRVQSLYLSMYVSMRCACEQLHRISTQVSMNVLVEYSACSPWRPYCRLWCVLGSGVWGGFLVLMWHLANAVIILYFTRFVRLGWNNLESSHHSLHNCGVYQTAGFGQKDMMRVCTLEY